MKIYTPTAYVNHKESVGQWFQLEVLNMWDFKNQSVCSSRCIGHTIRYYLNSCVATSDTSYKSTIVETLTDEMKYEIISMGYELTNN